MIYAILLIVLALVVAFLFIASTVARIQTFERQLADLLNHTHECIAALEQKLGITK